MNTIYFSSLRSRRALCAFIGVITLCGCATGPDSDPRDPLEPFNRGVYSFNTAVDKAVLMPVATAYKEVTPAPVKTAVGNFFGNIGDIWSSANAAMQLRPRETGENLMRVAVNTVFGLGGVLDVATEAGIPRTKIDFGQTLGRWGAPAGAYLVLPIFGPSSVRDTAGFLVDAAADPVVDLNNITSRNSLQILRAVNTRAELLGATGLLEEASLDPYSFTRDLYLSRRQSQIEGMIDKGVGLGDGK